MDYSKLPDNAARNSIRAYMERGAPVGEFLTALLSNDLVRAFMKADEVNAKAMEAWAGFLFWNAPASSWGSEKLVNQWIKKGGMRGHPTVAGRK